METAEKIIQKKQAQQRTVKVLLWVATLIVLAFVVRQIAYSESTPQKGLSSVQYETMQKHLSDLNKGSIELDAQLDQMQFDEDIRALRNQ